MFDTEMFICEIEKRPAIYDIKSKDYSNRDVKAKMWEEVAMVMYENWNELPVQDRNNLGKELQTRWKSLRDQFRKEVRATKVTESGQSAKKKKKYVYFDNLLFLLPTLNVKVTASNFREDTSTNEIETTVQRDDTELAIPDETPPLHVPPVQTPTAATRGITRKRARNDSSGVTEIREMTKLLSDNLALQSKNDQKDTFGNRAFLMSLVPFLDAMSLDNMFECRVSLMDTIRLYRSPRPLQHSLQNSSTSSLVLQSAELQSSSSSRPVTPASDASFQAPNSVQSSMSNVSNSYIVLQPAEPQSATDRPSTAASDAFESQISVHSQASNNTTSYMYMSQDSTPFDLYPNSLNYGNK